MEAGFGNQAGRGRDALVCRFQDSKTPIVRPERLRETGASGCSRAAHPRPALRGGMPKGRSRAPRQSGNGTLSAHQPSGGRDVALSAAQVALCPSVWSGRAGCRRTGQRNPQPWDCQRMGFVITCASSTCAAGRAVAHLDCCRLMTARTRRLCGISGRQATLSATILHPGFFQYGP